MCEASVYIIQEGEEQLVMESVDHLEYVNGKVRVVDLFGEEKVLDARVKSLSLVDHKIVLDKA